MNFGLKLLLTLSTFLILLVIAFNIAVNTISRPTFLHENFCYLKGSIQNLTTIPIGISPHWVNYCFIDFAVKYSNPAFCKNLTPNDQEFCIESIDFYKNKKLIK